MFQPLVLTSNVKGPTWSCEIHPLTAVVGETRQGKSAVVDALTLALRGAGPPGVGHFPTQIHGALAPVGASELFSELRTMDNFTFSACKILGSKKSLSPGSMLKDATKDVLSLCLPMAPVRSLLAFGDDRTREALASRFSTDVRSLDLLGLDDTASIAWRNALDASGPKAGLVKLAEAVPTVRKAVKAAQAKVRFLTQRIEALSEISSAGVERIPELERSLEEAIAAEAVGDTRNLARLALESIELNNAIACPICGGEHLSQTELIAKLRSQTQQAKTNQENKSSQLKVQLTNLRRAASSRKELEEAITALRTEKASVESLKMLEKQATVKLQLELRALSEMVDEKLNAGLPSEYRVKLLLDKDACEFLLLGSDGEYHPLASSCGTEKVNLRCALADVWGKPAPVRMMILEDDEIGPFHGSPAALSAFLNTRESKVRDGTLTHLIAVGLRREEVPAGWHVVER